MIQDLEIDKMVVDTVACEEEINMEITDYVELVMRGILNQTHFLQLLKVFKQAPSAWFKMAKQEFQKLGPKQEIRSESLYWQRSIYLIICR